MKAICKTPVVGRTLWSISPDLLITELTEANEIQAFSRFVFNVYRSTYLEQYNWIPESTTQQLLEEEDLQYAPDSKFFACCTRNLEIIGTCRITKKNNYFTFPIETEFDINLEELINRLSLSVKEFWHFGRLAINKELLRKYSADSRSSIVLLKELLMTSFRIICRFESNLLIAETDSKVFRMLNQLGINVEMIGNPKNYMGSETLPTIVAASDLSHWSQLNKVTF